VRPRIGGLWLRPVAGKIVNKGELSEILGKTERTLTTWQKNGLPILREGRAGVPQLYDTEEVIQWLIDRATHETRGNGAGGQISMAFDWETQRGRLVKYQADNEELRFRQSAGDLWPLEAVVIALQTMQSAAKNKLLGISSKLKQRYPETEGEITDTVTDLVEESLNDLTHERFPENLSQCLGEYFAELETTAEVDA